MPFAKLFDLEDGRQILVKKDQNAFGAPEVRFYFEPEGLGVCSVAGEWDDTEEGWEKAEAVFAQTDAEEAKKRIAVITAGISKVVPEGAMCNIRSTVSAPMEHGIG